MSFVIALAPPLPDTAHWQGRSGRLYTLVREPAGDFALRDGEVYLLARGPRVAWVGAARDLIEDQASRARFRRALLGASAAYRLAAPADDLARMTLIWDLEDAHSAPDLSAA